ncbi:hypothetical protein [Clostridium sp.]|uniref:hypothetical protein n=1 Tax=Clostridium sp. TaxID=1506 RepID=UPI00263450C3|nr:hypothetical protein [Clostridium sp.]
MLRYEEGDEIMSNDMRLSGRCKVNGGEYNHIEMAGYGKITGEVKANSIDLAGYTKALKNINVSYLSTAGKFKVAGNIRSKEEIITAGTFKALKNIEGKRIFLGGSFKCLGDMAFDFLDIKGNIKCNGNCEGRKVLGEGRIRIGGLLSADEIEIKLSGTSIINEIGGEKIKIEEGNKQNIKIGALKYKQKALLNCKSIEGDYITLQNTNAKIVRGKNITIGKNCIIDKVEYSGELKVKEGCLIKERVKIY